MKLPDYRRPNRFARPGSPVRTTYYVYWYVFELYAGHAVNRDLGSESVRGSPHSLRE